MKPLRKWCAACGLLMAAALLSSCDMMHEDRDDCPTGLYVTFKYDYNLQRADMFNDHVGSVTLYVFDGQGKLVKTQEESNAGAYTPLKDAGYKMHVTGLTPGEYRFIALAGQKPYADMLGTQRAKFVRRDMTYGSSMTDLDIVLDHERRTDGGGYDVVNNGLPLDTLWHGIETESVRVYDTKPTYDTISLVRDTKKINITLRELDDPSSMDINDYDLRIEDRNAHILYDNSLDETDRLIYTPHAAWNTEDRTTAFDSEGNPIEGVGRIGHADFMTSRILYHDKAEDDGHLIITNKTTGKVIVNVNLPDMLSRLRTNEERYIYSRQAFLDRGYDYQLHFYLKNGSFQYVSIEISVLSWAVRVQHEELE